MSEEENELVGLMKLLMECGHLKKIPRSGWLKTGVERPESVAEHVFRTALIGFFLAMLEGRDERLTTVLCLFHDLPESRISDLDHLARSYLNPSVNSEEEALLDQLKRLPKAVRKQVVKLLDQGGKEVQIARDADRLECAIQAAEYICGGYSAAEEWLIDSVNKLEGETAKQLGNLLLKMYNDESLEGILRWWQ